MGAVRRIVDDEVGPLATLVAIGLGGDPGFGVGLGEAPLVHQTGQSQFDGTVHDHDDGEIQEISMGGHEKRDIEDHDVVGPLLPGPSFSHDGADGGMGDGVQGPQGLGVVEDDGGQCGPVEKARRRQDVLTESLDQWSEGDAVRGDDLAGDAVGVDQDGAPGHQKIGDRRFARSHPPRQADGEHGPDA